MRLGQAPVAQLDRALPSEGRGHRFESCRARHLKPPPSWKSFDSLRESLRSDVRLRSSLFESIDCYLRRFVRSCSLEACSAETGKRTEMATKIGIRDVAALQPHTILWDSTVRGFHVRRQYGDAITFAVFYRNAENRQRWHRIGRYGVWTPDQARKEAQRVLRAKDLGEDPTAERMALRSAPTMEQLCDEYIADMQAGKINGKKASTIKSDISRIATHIKPKLGTRKVNAVTPDDVETFMRSFNEGSARRVTGLLGAIFSYSIKRKLRETNPVHGLDKPADVKRMRRLAESEYAQLWGALQNVKNVASDVFLFLAVSGWRSGEVKNLRSSDN
jgi:integrase